MLIFKIEICCVVIVCVSTPVQNESTARNLERSLPYADASQLHQFKFYK